ncbi:hypothetical protein [Nostoc sp. 'Peltigera malacea cyanobiont' DB3992]|uniref:hypothetical protein n=1 Tax=Nostoc sp. 'Peltigera malacea cyanobiont' DB3992 TaxID=1206980 RepID=UPI0015D497DF|nr:hypothetical protein [Nostoc sp. 'Peltigera malacea cyanobiont' DB3992]
MKLALQRLEVSTSQPIIDDICDFELLPWRDTGQAIFTNKNFLEVAGLLNVYCREE